MKEGFIYGTNSLYDVVFLVFRAIVFGAYLIIGSFVGFYSQIWFWNLVQCLASSYWFRKLRRWTGRRRRLRWISQVIAGWSNLKFRSGWGSWLISAISLLAFLALAFSIRNRPEKKPIDWGLIGFFLLCGWFWIGAVSELRVKKTTPSRESYNRLALLFAPVFLLVPYSLIAGRIIDRSMSSMSLRSDSQETILLTASGLAKVKGLAEVYTVPIRVCEVSKGFWSISRAILVWHGPGGTAFLRIGSGGPGQGILIPLSNDQVELVRASGQAPGECRG